MSGREYIWKYNTPEGFDDLWMRGDGKTLTGLWFDGSRDAAPQGAEMRGTPVFRDTARWLDGYFSGRPPSSTPSYRIDGLTAFRKDVIDELLRIPYGATVSYGDIARAISGKHGGRRVSARAVGGAVGWNPISVIIPCHRVIGADASLTGYGGGLGNKMSLLAHEGSAVFDVRLSAPKAGKTHVDPALLRRCLRAVNRAAARHGLGRAAVSDDGDGAVMLLDDLVCVGYDAPFIFDGCSDADARLLLESFVGYPSLYHFDLAFQLSRLLARRGGLVGPRMERLLAEKDWSSWAENGLLLSYLASKAGSGPQICRLLDIVPVDNRDGLFLACWHSPDAAVQERLRQRFEAWTADDPSWGSGTGEAWWLGAFLSKWTRERTFPPCRLQSLVRWHLVHEGPEDL